MAQINLGASLSLKRGLKRMCWSDFGIFQFFSNITQIFGEIKISINNANLWLKLTLELR